MFDYNLVTPSGPATVHIGLPHAEMLKFPPDELPATLPAPHLAQPTWYQPFNIPPQLYTQLLDVRVPITIASLYALTVVLLNRVNKSRGYKPYAFSQTRWFKAFVILHNVLLAIYSAWTFAAMFRAFRNSLPGYNEPHGLAGWTDSLCKIYGPRGYGNAALYNATTEQWTMPNPQFSLAEGGVPDLAHDGRLWNQGLAFLGWIFYLSKFYEVFDTAIILAKGKKSSTLQTYHHTGAMMCMWAGIRYVAAPIWIFTLVNSFIHAMMYTYYTFTALRIRVPGVIKRSLTSMQITQFLFGTTMAASYLFVHYTLPFWDAPESGVASPSGSWLSKLGLGGSGQQQPIGLPAVGPKLPGADYRMVPCLDTTGQAFAVSLNVSYLLPLTYLFVRFFVRSYLYRKEPSAPQPTHMHAAEKAGLDALKGVSREIQKAVEVNGETSETTEDETAIKAQARKGKSAPSTASNPPKDSPIRTRSSAARKSAANGGRQEGFSPVRKGVKKSEGSAGSSPAETTNPYGVLRKS